MILRISTVSSREWTLAPRPKLTTREVCDRLRDGRAVVEECVDGAVVRQLADDAILADLERREDPETAERMTFCP